MKPAPILIALALGFAGGYWFASRGTVPLDAFQAVQEAHIRAEARGLDLSAQSEAKDAEARTYKAEADSLRRVRKNVRTVVLMAPDSVAHALGLTVTTQDSVWCLPAAELAGLLADRVELRLADSATVHDTAALSACMIAVTLSDSAATVHREDAGRLYGAAQDLAQKVEASRRTRWLWAAGGAVAMLLTVIGVGAL